jgi:integrase
VKESIELKESIALAARARGLNLHDFRRGAVRALNSAGVSIKTAMSLVGHRTMSVYHRYGITDKADLLHGGEKLAAYFAKNPPSEQKVVQLKTGTE